MYEHSLKVPLVFQGPGIPANVRNEALTYLIDIYPTLCDLTHAKTPSLVEGISLAPLLKGEKNTHRKSMIYAYKNNQRAFRQGDYKLIKYLVDGNRNNQLFNIKEDPWEMNNLYGQEEYKKVVSKLEEQMQEALREAGDEVILKAQDWALAEIPKWIDKVSQETIDWLRDLAERERNLRGF